MDAGPAARTLIASLTRAALPSAWTVYDRPVETVAAPCAMVVPRQPYRERTTHQMEQVNLSVVLLMNRATDEDAIDTIDHLMDVVRASIETDQRVIVPSIADLGPPVSIGGVDHLSGRLDVTVHADC